MAPIRVALSLLVAIAALTPAAAIAAPKELYGKSVVISWSEERMQRQAGWSEFRPVRMAGSFSVYVGNQGNVFNRMTMNNGRASGSKDRVGNGANGHISFQGNSMVAIQTTAGGARRIVATFSSGFTGCTAEAVRGKEEGAATIHADSVIYAGMKVEIQSVHTSGVTCSIRDGNVFANQ